MQSPIQARVSTRAEWIAFETLWGIHGQSSKKLHALYQEHSAQTPALLVKRILDASLFNSGFEHEERVQHVLDNLRGFSVCIAGDFDFPDRLLDARYPARLVYYRGAIALTQAPIVAVVGTRNATAWGLDLAAGVGALAAKHGIAVISGLARGIDTAAMQSVLSAGGRTIGVLGTPILEAYPPENAELQERVATNHLLISHVPFYRHATEPFHARRRYFPERNEIMAAISSATVVVEASETSGTLQQARTALRIGRPVYVATPKRVDDRMKWFAKLVKSGAKPFSTLNELETILINEYKNSEELEDSRNC